MDASNEQLRDDTLSARRFDPGAAADPPARARAVVIGGGIIGASVAYHLAELGWTDVVVLERGRVSCGTSWHAAGLMTRTRGTHVLTELATYSGAFYADLERRSGVDIGYYVNGSLSIAQTPERMTELMYALTMAHHHGLPAQRLDPDELTGPWPPVETSDLVGGVLFEGDATVNPGVAAYATAKAAFDRGVRIVEDCRVTGFRLAGSRVTGVETDRGTIECEVAVIAAGLWSRELGRLAGARLPLHAAEHMWVQTEPVEGASRELPILRDLDGHFYVRHYRGGLVVGAFEPDGKPRADASIPADFAFGEFEPDWKHFEPPLAKARRRVPALEGARFAHFLNAPESFTPDGDFLLGETAEVAGLYVAAGLNSQGIIFGPGVGRALAAWIDAGAPTIDASAVDVRRFAPEQANARYLYERTRESLGRLYAMHWPFLQPETARGLRRVPLYDRLAAAGACFGETAGWERANWYAPPGAEPVYRYSFGRQNWFGAAAQEHRAAREAVALFDLSSFAKFRVQGPDGAPDDAAHLLRRARPGARRDHVHLHAQPSGRDRARRHGHAARAGRVPRRRADRYPDQDPPLAAAPCRGRDERDRRHVRAGHARCDGPAFAGAPRGPHRRSPRRCVVPLRHGAADRRRLGDGARPPHLLRRRAGLGAVRAGRVARAALRPARARGSRPGPAARRLPCPRLAARREGLPPLGRGHRAGRHAVRGRPGLHRRDRTRRCPSSGATPCARGRTSPSPGGSST